MGVKRVMRGSGQGAVAGIGVAPLPGFLAIDGAGIGMAKAKIPQLGETLGAKDPSVEGSALVHALDRVLMVHRIAMACFVFIALTILKFLSVLVAFVIPNWAVIWLCFKIIPKKYREVGIFLVCLGPAVIPGIMLVGIVESWFKELIKNLAC